MTGRRLVAAVTAMLCCGTLAAPLRAQSPHLERNAPAAHRVFVHGVGRSGDYLRDPNSPENLIAFRHNFDGIITLSQTEGIRGTRLLDSYRRAWGWADDYMLLFGQDLRGRLSNHAKGEFRVLANKKPVDELYVYSWASVAAYNAIMDGVIPAPRRLIVISPPNLTASGGRQWKQLTISHPEMKVDIFISPTDVAQVVRSIWYEVPRVPATQIDGAVVDTLQDYINYPLGGLSRWVDFLPTTLGQTIFHYLDPRQPGQVTVKTYPGGHSISRFFAFLATTNQYGITRRSRPGADPAPTSSVEATTLPALSGNDGYPFLYGLAAKYVEVNRARQQHQVAIDEQERAAQRAEEQSRREWAGKFREMLWSYVLLTGSMACHAPQVLEQADRDGQLPAVFLNQADMQDFFSRDNGELTPCVRDVVGGIVRARGPIEYRDLLSRAAKYRRPPPTPPAAPTAADDIDSRHLEFMSPEQQIVYLAWMAGKGAWLSARAISRGAAYLTKAFFAALSTIGSSDDSERGRDGRAGSERSSSSGGVIGTAYRQADALGTHRRTPIQIFDGSR